MIFNYIVDCCFLIDIFIIFNSAVYDDNFEIIDDRAQIIQEYLKGWFAVDVIAIFPFELIIGKDGEAANLVRFIRIGRITKLLKLMKLMRLMRLQKAGSFSVMSWLQDQFKISREHNWFVKFFIFFAMTTHVTACFWIIAGSFDPDTEHSWMTSYKREENTKADLYLTSFYFTITTITTVGYGDFSASTFNEKIICVFIMVSGVIAFSMASGALTNYISQQEMKSEQYETRMTLLDGLFKEYKFPQMLYSRIKKNIENNDVADTMKISDFVEDLPLDLKTPLSIHIYKNLYCNVDFLRSKTPQFIAWICPMLKCRVAGPDEVIYYEGDMLNHVYFLKSGECKYVLPMYANTPYISIVNHTYFGIIDIVVALLEKAGKHIHECGIMAVLDPKNEEEEHMAGLEENNNLFMAEVNLRRSFTVRSAQVGSSELLSINKHDLFRMKIEFRECFAEFFQGGIKELEKTITIKIYSMEWC